MYLFRLIQTSLITLAEIEATAVIQRLADSGFHYHNLDHTRGVVGVTRLLAQDLGCDDHTTELLAIAAWFHDTGYDDMERHEMESARLAKEFLERNACSAVDIESVSAIILATNIHAEPQNLAEQIIRDADLHYLGVEDYYPRANRLRDEWEITQKRQLSDEEWYRLNLTFFNTHRFYTNAGEARFGQQKERNKKSIELKLAQL